MVVYVLMVGYDYEGSDCLGVYESQEAAQAAFDSYDSGGYCEIQERVIGAAPCSLS